MPCKQVTDYQVNRKDNLSSSTRCRLESVLARPESVSSVPKRESPDLVLGGSLFFWHRGLLNNLCYADGFLAAALFARPKRKRNRNAAGLVTSPSCRSAQQTGCRRRGARIVTVKCRFSSEFSWQRAGSRSSTAASVQVHTSESAKTGRISLASRPTSVEFAPNLDIGDERRSYG